MKKFLYSIWSQFLTMFGNIKCFKYPLFLVYDPDDYQITGIDMLNILDIIEPGDIILRGYNNYLDGKFIPSHRNNKIGKGFSHGGIYIGDNKVVHAIAEGVSYINILDFIQCDRIAIFRPKKYQKSAIKIAKQFVDDNIPYDFAYARNASALYCFELCVECYPKLDIPIQNESALFGIIKKQAYVAQSFVESKDLMLVYCKNKKSDICYQI